MDSVPPKISAPAAPSKVPAAILAAVALAVAAAVFFFNPSTHTFYPVCQFRRLTGLDCPGCGMTRALHALLHGKFFQALHDNALFVGLLGLAMLRAAWLVVEKFRGRPAREFFPVKFLWPLLAVALVFAVLRNLPAFAFLSPDNQAALLAVPAR